MLIFCTEITSKGLKQLSSEPKNISSGPRGASSSPNIYLRCRRRRISRNPTKQPTQKAARTPVRSDLMLNRVGETVCSFSSLFRRVSSSTERCRLLLARSKLSRSRDHSCCRHSSNCTEFSCPERSSANHSLITGGLPVAESIGAPLSYFITWCSPSFHRRVFSPLRRLKSLLRVIVSAVCSARLSLFIHTAVLSCTMSSRSVASRPGLHPASSNAVRAIIIILFVFISRSLLVISEI